MRLERPPNVGNAEVRILAEEVCGCLVALLIFKISVAEHLGQAGSIPVRLRHCDEDP